MNHTPPNDIYVIYVRETDGAHCSIPHTDEAGLSSQTTILSTAELLCSRGELVIRAVHHDVAQQWIEAGSPEIH